jgi:aryl-alcohol dehydrogenase-like predicted oxidoreductase
MNIRALPEKMLFAAPYIEKLENIAKDFGLSRHEIAFGYIKSEMPTAKVVFGVETTEQITENVAACQKSIPSLLVEKIRMNFSNVGEQILNPHLW